MRFQSRPSTLIYAALLTLSIAVTIGASQAAAEPTGPAAASVAGSHPGLAALAAPPTDWGQTGSPATVAGEALFNVINGGAEMYLQIGFRQAVFNAFKNPNGLTVNLEIYEMDDPEAARAIFAQKAGNSGHKVPFGQDARLDSYYLNFWRGRYQVTISGYASTPETLDAIRKVAATVDKRLQDD